MTTGWYSDPDWWDPRPLSPVFSSLRTGGPVSILGPPDHQESSATMTGWEATSTTRRGGTTPVMTGVRGFRLQTGRRVRSGSRLSHKNQQYHLRPSDRSRRFTGCCTSCVLTGGVYGYLLVGQLFVITMNFDCWAGLKVRRRTSTLPGRLCASYYSLAFLPGYPFSGPNET